jgi:nicotinate-nucleotide adenylyltransferase
VGRAVIGRHQGLGVFGGTFDPIHLAHLAVAESARDSLGLERVLFMPAGVPPHKPDQAISSGADRLAMVEAAIAGNPAFEASRIELDRPGPSYTVDTLEALAVTDPDLVLILSSEAYAGLPTWHEPRRVLELARLAIAPRDGCPPLPGDGGTGRGARRAAHPTVSLGTADARRHGTVPALPGPGCGGRLYRRP